MSSLSFPEMLKAVRCGGEFSQSFMAEKIGYSVQYWCDLEKGRRNPSVEFVNRLCNYMGRKQHGRLEWHRAAARAHGWEV